MNKGWIAGSFDIQNYFKNDCYESIKINLSQSKIYKFYADG